MKQRRIAIYFLTCTCIVLGLWLYHNKNKFSSINQVSRPIPQLSSNEQKKATLHQNIDDQIEIAGEKFSALFEAGNVSTTMREIIVSDIELNFTYCTNVTIRFVNNKPRDQWQIYQTPVNYVLEVTPNMRRWFPKVIQNYLYGVYKKDNHYQIVIHEMLIKAYEKAQQFKDSHNVMFQKLNEFLAQLRDKELISKIEHGPKGIAKNFLLCETDPGQNYDYEREMVGFLKQAEIRKPSILDFVWTKQGKSNVIVCATVIKWSNGDISKYWPQFIYIDDQWKIFLPNLP